MTATLLVILAILAAGAAGLAFRMWQTGRPKRGEQALPTEWSLTPRPVFNEHERRVHRQLREALPQHVVLAKLPLVRFCQPNDPGQVRFWFDLLGAIHVSFAVCSQGGRVLAAIDLEDTRGAAARRSTLIKQAVLAACHVRYVRYAADQTPSVPELQLLVPAAAVPAFAPPHQAQHAAHPAHAAGAQPGGAVMRGGFSNPAARNVDAFRQRAHPARWPDAHGRDSSSFGRDSVISGFSHSVPTVALPLREGEVVDTPAVRH
ncbi:MAG: DUF2726 domain-containing protein [Rubrivivax sp.]|nr:DUF2726 domain-containing protein [Rubrivivax sp.]